jgi:hypothetical protein
LKLKASLAWAEVSAGAVSKADQKLHELLHCEPLRVWTADAKSLPAK